MARSARRADDADVHRLLADPSRRRVLKLLRAHGPSDAHRLAAVTGLHPTTVRFHLERLAGAGLVTSARQARPARGRPRMIYTAVAAADDNARASGYQALAEALVQGIAATADSATTAIDAGLAWGRRQASDLGGGDGREQLIALLDRWGFAPEMTDDATVALTSCPLIDMARDHPKVVCSLHLGVLRGALDELGTTLAVAGLQPFVERDRCLVTLAHRDATSDGTAHRSRTVIMRWRHFGRDRSRSSTDGPILD
jgi:predicted ArsR family transcriptional regulator